MSNDSKSRTVGLPRNEIERAFPNLIPLLRGLRLKEQDGELRVYFAHKYFAAWFGENWRSAFEAALAEFRPDLKLSYSNEFPDQKAPGAKPAQNPAPRDQFADFICRDKNAEAVTALKTLARAEKACFLILYGDAGVGKTHLLRAVANSLIDAGEAPVADKASFFCANQPLAASAAEIFWRAGRALLLDDLQDLENDDRGQQILSFYLDAAENSRFAQTPPIIALACLRRPSGSTNFNARLRARLARALALELEPPDLDTRLRFAELAGKTLPYPPSRRHCLCVAKNTTLIPEIMGVFKKIEFFGKLRGRFPDGDELEELATPEAQPKFRDAADLLNLVAKKFALTADELLSSSRKNEIAFARQIAAYLCRRKLGLSYPELGKLLGGKDHSTVMHGVKKIMALLDSDKDTRKLITELEKSAE